MASLILLELINATQTDATLKIRDKAKASDLNRIDFIVAIEKIEYSSVITHEEMASNAVKAGDWKQAALIYQEDFFKKDKAGKEVAISFDDYMAIEIKKNHAVSYAVLWGRFEKTWLMKHEGENRDAPVETLTKTLANTTLESLQKALKVFDGK